MSNFKVVNIYRYPVKSMAGETLSETYMGPQGLTLDRGWAVKHEETGNIVGGKQFGDLMQCSAHYLTDTSAGLVPHVAVTLPDGQVINSDDSKIHAALSDLLGAKVSLWPLQPKENTDHYSRKATGVDMLQEWRDQIGLRPDDPSPDFSDMPTDVLKELFEYSVPLGTYFDALPISLLSRASLRTLSKVVPDFKMGPERFRPNILVDADDGTTGYPEFSWADKIVHIGETQLAIKAKATRCIMVARAQPGFDEDKQIIRALFKETEMKLSVYANVIQPGPLRTGDKLKVV